MEKITNSDVKDWCKPDLHILILTAQDIGLWRQVRDGLMVDFIGHLRAFRRG